eukprot:1159355-Pelagomonas_calceolata.AAC.2
MEKQVKLHMQVVSVMEVRCDGVLQVHCYCLAFNEFMHKPDRKSAINTIYYYDFDRCMEHLCSRGKGHKELLGDLTELLYFLGLYMVVCKIIAFASSAHQLPSAGLT